jgi:hypothetical protein
MDAGRNDDGGYRATGLAQEIATLLILVDCTSVIWDLLEDA